MSDLYMITDVGSTTTKAILIGLRDGEYRLLGRGEMPTTVEAPYEDATIGVLSALSKLGDAVKKPLTTTDGDAKATGSAKITSPAAHTEIGSFVNTGERAEIVGRAEMRASANPGGPAKTAGDDIIKYLSTSSAGGGLQVMVFGVTRKVTASSAKNAALGGGAIILDVLCTDDDRPTFQKLDIIRGARPDMILISGGIDGGNTRFALEIADLLNAANPRPRFGADYRIPVIYAGNADAAPLVVDTLRSLFDVKVVENLRPAFDREALEPARNAIHELFMSHVMAQAPGYDKLRLWVDADIMPTPTAVGRIMKAVSAKRGVNILGVDIGGATTDVFSVVDRIFARSVSANLGMSYSAGNVLVEAGIENIMRWLPFEASKGEVSDRICTKLINPTTVPSRLLDLQIEQALATEALRLAFLQHQEVARTIPPDLDPDGGFMVQERLMASTRERTTLVEIEDIDLFVGSGGVLSHAPRREQAALMMLNAYLPVGLSHLAIDSIFMMPHLGVLSQIDPETALSVLEKDCFVPVGPVVAPEGNLDEGKPVVSVRIRRPGERERSVTVNGGEIRVVELRRSYPATIEVSALGNARFRRGSTFSFESLGGVVGLIIDARGRPLPCLAGEDPRVRAERNARWAAQIGAYVQETPARDEDVGAGACEVSGRTQFRSAAGSAGSKGESASRLTDRESPPPYGDELCGSLQPAGAPNDAAIRGDTVMRVRPLPASAKVLVTEGEEVKPETAVARIETLPGRLWRLDIAHELCEDPGAVPDLMLRQPGDKIAAGDVVACAGDFFERRVVRSPVNGVVALLSKVQGFAYLREDVEMGEGSGPVVVDVAKQLQCPPAFILALKAANANYGSVVVKGQILASRRSGGKLTSVASPIYGKITGISASRGTITVTPIFKSPQISAYIGGRVTRISADGVEVTARAKVVNGLWGLGEESRGPVQVVEGDLSGESDLLEETVVVSRGTATMDGLMLAQQKRTRGVILGYLPSEVVMGFAGGVKNMGITGDEDVPFPLILVQGFLPATMNEAVFSALKEAVGQVVSLRGVTHIRAGVIRPEIVIPTCCRKE